MKVSADKVVALAVTLLVATLGHVWAQQDTTVRDKDINIVGWEELTYPPLIQSAGIEGVVVVKANIDDRGQVIQTAAISGHDLLVPACLANTRKWRFQPNDQKTVVLVYLFRLEGDCRNNEPSSHSDFHRPNLLTITGCRRLTEP